MRAVMRPSRPVGSVRPPCSKSMAHRALFCAMAAGGGTVRGLDVSDDVAATQRAVRELTDSAGSGSIDCGESASTLRFALPFALAAGRPFTFTGRGRLLARPLDVYERLCRAHGWTFTRTERGLTVCGALAPGEYDLGDCGSSQFLTGMMLALGAFARPSTLRFGALPSRPYIDLTADVMALFGQNPTVFDHEIRVGGGYRPADASLEGDWSQAAVFAALGALGGDVTLLGVTEDSRQGDRAIVSRLREMGARIEGLRFRGGALRALPFDCAHRPDLAPVIAALGCFADGETVIAGAGRLRDKESDRMSAIVRVIGDLGGRAEARGDAIIIQPSRLRGGVTSSHGDHRIAMMAAVLGCFADGPVTVEGAEAVSKSYPSFWRDLASLGAELTLDG